jgi:SAM-dependent methyltransferase
MNEAATPHIVFDRAALRAVRMRAERGLSSASSERPDFLLTRVVEDFMERLSFIRRTFRTALDLGCHHGALGGILAMQGGIADVVFADDLPARILPGGSMRQDADLEALPFAAESFDLAVSALSLQSVNDLPGTLAQVRSCLKPDGLFMGALLGGRTLQELREAFLIAETDIRGGAGLHVAPVVDVRDLGTLLQRAGFALPVVDSDVVEVTYAHPLALMHDLRAMGATNVLAERSRGGLRRDVLAHAIEVYRRRFAAPDGRVRATFEILTATAWAPHANQQKPLARGSATMRLSDALKPTHETKT